MKDVKLLEKVVIKGKIKAETGLHMGGSPTALDIGGVDNPIITDERGRPYIPGSSLKGKIRSLLEKADGKKLEDVSKKPHIRIHKCEGENVCEICKIFGLPAKKETKTEPPRLIVRDSALIENSIPEDIRKNLDLDWTEVKWENVIDRITSAANPRQMERVPAGAKFNFEMVYNVYEDADKENLKHVFRGMELLEHDYLGGSGSRGYGKIKFEDIEIYKNTAEDYKTGTTNIKEKSPLDKELKTPAEIRSRFENIKLQL